MTNEQRPEPFTPVSVGQGADSDNGAKIGSALFSGFGGLAEIDANDDHHLPGNSRLSA
jgi:hypothetical protein